MKSFLIAVFLATIKNCSSQTVLPSSGVCMDMSENLKEFIRTVLSRGFVDIKEDISHALKTQSAKWSAENKQTRVLVDILDEKQVNTVYSTEELKEGLTNLSYRTDSLLHASRNAFLEKNTNLSNAIHVNHLHIKTFEEEMTLLHGKYWNQTNNLTELSKQVTHLSVQYNWTVSNISELHLNIREMGENSAEQILHTLARVNQTEDNLKTFFDENLQNKTKELFDQFSMLRRDVRHIAKSAVTQSEWTEQSINFLKESLQNETNELQVIRENLTYIWESAATQAGWTEKSILQLKESLQNETYELHVIRENLTYLSVSAATQAERTQTSIIQLKDSVQNETSELSGHISFLQENITHLTESAVTQEKSILRLKEENKELKSMLERLQTEIDELKQNVSASMDMVLQPCRPGWIQYGTSCYLASTKQMSWASAKLQCVSYGSKLVEIENKDENDFLKDILIKDNARYLTGGTDQDTEGQWIWATSGNVIRFSDWYPGEPNNAGEEDCMELHVSTQENAWNDVPCQNEYKFICERLSY